MQGWGLIILIVLIVLVGIFAWWDGQRDSRVCQDAGYEDYHEDSTGGWCYLWQAGRKVLTPFGEVE